MLEGRGGILFLVYENTLRVFITQDTYRNKLFFVCTHIKSADEALLIFLNIHLESQYSKALLSVKTLLSEALSAIPISCPAVCVTSTVFLPCPKCQFMNPVQ